MKICVVGAGAIGGLVAAKLSLTGHAITVVEQGAQLEAIRKNGLKLIWHDGSEYQAQVTRACSSCEQAGQQELVILALKAHILASVAPRIPALFSSQTMVLTLQNGIPWWYFQRHGGPWDGHSLRTLDPDGILARTIDARRIIGAVVYPAAAVSEPAVIQHVEGDRIPIGELDGSTTDRIQDLYEVLGEAGFRSRILADLRSEIWLKAWGNLSFNPISALTHATLVDICEFPETRKLATRMMSEARQIAEKLGIQFRHSIEKRIEGARSVGAHKTSMLQDVEVGRSLEVEALMGVVLELGRLTDTPAPSIESAYACVKLLNQTMLQQGVGVVLTAAG